MRENYLRRLWQEGGTAVNCWLTIDSSVSAEALAQLDWNSMTVDLQHGLVDWDAAVPILQTISATDAVPMMRVPWNNPAWIMRALDAGAYGGICPMVNSSADCEAFVGACRFAPTGYRSWGPVRGLIYGGPDYFQHANDTVLAIAMIETDQAMANLDEILSTKGLDAIYVGPNDLAVSLGYEPQYTPKDPEVGEAIDTILAAALRHGIVPGIHCGSADMAAEMTAKGFQLVTLTSDTRLLVDAAADAIISARRT